MGGGIGGIRVDCEPNRIKNDTPYLSDPGYGHDRYGDTYGGRGDTAEEEGAGR